MKCRKMNSASKKKSGNKDNTIHAIVFVTAILNLIKSILDIIEKLT